MSEQGTVIGTVAGITEKPNGWFEVQIAMPGKQYPLKVATKKEEIIADVRSVGTAIATFNFTERESEKINPHNNQPYRDRYLEGVTLGATDEAQAAAAQTSQNSSPAGGSRDEMTKADWEAKERRDYRSRAWAHTFSAMAHTIKVDEEPQAIYDRLHPLQRLIFVDIVRNLTDDEGRDDPDLPF